jgi:hypothetical protein
LRDGGVEAVEVEVHPDPRCQEMLEQIREAEIIQAADRVRPIFNERSIVLLNELALDMTYDRIMTHGELVMGGNRFERAAERGPAVPLSASELARCFPKLWDSPNAVKMDFRRLVKGVGSPIEILLGKGPHLNRARYRRAGQPGRPTPALIRSDVPDARAALESVVGPVEWFEVETPDVVRVEAPNRPVVEFGKPVLTVVPFKPAVEDMARLQRIVGAADKLASLSARLERFRPPIPDQREQVPRRAVGQ